MKPIARRKKTVIAGNKVLVLRGKKVRSVSCVKPREVRRCATPTDSGGTSIGA